MFVVELLTGGGKRVGEYFHFGWFFNAKTGALDRAGHEDIFLAGVDDVAGNTSDYGATLVVLDAERVEGQASTLSGDGRALRGVPAAREKAVLLFQEFAPNPDPNGYCRGHDLSFSKDALQLRIAQSDGGPGALYRLNRHLKLESITPELLLLKALGPTLLRNVPPDRWGDTVTKSFGEIRYVRNEFH